VPDDLGAYIRALHAFDAELDATLIAEVLWLAAALPPAGGTGTARSEPPVDAQATTPDEPEPEITAPPDPGPPPEGSPSVPPAPDHGRAGPGPDAVPGREVQVRRPRALPASLEMGRALRPLKRRWPDGRRLALDLAATEQAFAYTRQLLPRFRRAPERWFELQLVLDGSPAMALWDETATELTGLLHQLGAFRRIRTSRLSFENSRPVFRNEQGLALTADQMRASDGRRLILVFSDGSDPAWRRPQIWGTLRAWAELTPTALLSPLPPHIWRRTGLDLPATRVSNRSPGGTSAGFGFAFPFLLDPEDGWMPIPISALSPHPLAEWTRTMMRADPRGCDALLVPGAGFLFDQDEPVAGADLADAFLRVASSPARRLAVLCAPFAWVTLPMLQLIREKLVPSAGTEDVAEVAVSGLFQQVESVLHFLPDVRSRLEEHLGESDAWDVFETLRRQITLKAGPDATFAAAVHDPSGPLSLPPDLRILDHASQEVLRFLGALPAGVPVLPDPERALAVEEHAGEPVEAPALEILPGIEIVPIWIPGPPDVGAPDPGPGQIAELLRDFGGRELDWPVDPARRDLQAVMVRLGLWAAASGMSHSVLFWQGHGVLGEAPSLLTATGGPGEALTPSGLADFVQLHWAARRTDPSWALVVIEADNAAAFVEELMRILLAGSDRPRRLAVVRVDTGESAPAGTFQNALARVLDGPFLASSEVSLPDFLSELGRGLEHGGVRLLSVSGAEVLTRTVPLGLRFSLLATRDPGEVSYLGGDDVIARIVRWAQGEGTALLAITGPAGSGKSALLHRLITLSLADRGSREGVPRIDAALSLAARTAERLPAELAAALGVTAADPAGLIMEVAARPRPLLLVLDALDEALNPERVAAEVLLPLARADAARIIVSGRDGLDLAVLGDDVTFLHMGDYQLADLEGFVLRRLSEAVENGRLTAEPAEIDAAAVRIRRAYPDLRHAVLIVQEIVDHPGLIRREQAARLDRLLEADLAGLSPTARLRTWEPLFGFALEALALAQGRGLPLHGGVWAAAATALAGEPVSEALISELIEAAGPAIVADTEFGQATSRLSPEVRAELHTGDSAGHHQRVYQGFSDLAHATLPGELDPYLVHHLPAHAALGGSWSELVADIPVFGRLDSRVVSDTLASTRRFVRLDLGGRVRKVAVATVNGRSFLATADDQGTILVWDPGNPGAPSVHVNEGGEPSYAIAWTTSPVGRTYLAVAGENGVVRLWEPQASRYEDEIRTGHAGRVATIASLEQPQGTWLLVTAGADQTLRTWDFDRGLQSVRIAESSDGDADLVPVPLPGGSTALADRVDGRIRLWDARSGLEIAGQPRPEAGVVAAAARGGHKLLVNGSGATVYIWDLLTGRPVIGPLRDHTGEVTALTATTTPDGGVLLASGDADGAIRLWDLQTGEPIGGPFLGHTGDITTLAWASLDDGRTLLVSGSTDHTVRIWDASRAGPAQTRRTPPSADEAHRDAVVLIPGFGGSELVDASTGEFLWGGGDAAWYVRLWARGEGLQRLYVTDEERSGRTARITARGLIRAPGFFPGLRGVEPATRMASMLRSATADPEAVLEFAYDWRLGMAYNATLLGEAARGHLDRWRTHPKGSAGARIILVAHASGGLIAEYFVALLGGQDLVSTTITLGTPFAGTVAALEQFSQRPDRPVLPRVRARELFISMPGLYDMLPTYRCVRETVGARSLTPADVSAIGGDAELADSSFTEHGTLRAAPRVDLSPIAGVGQPTALSVELVRDGVVPFRQLSLLDSSEQLVEVEGSGDSVVPLLSASRSGDQPNLLPQTHANLMRALQSIELVRYNLALRRERGSAL
jgi:WD40 repeat protein